ncbi:hypothetical protein Taro_032177, partial [Colocasia esculenta]|nr:hypothetical protein [Colocasia esculenta]
YNQLIDHVGIHGQRRLTEALNKDSLVWQKEYPTESSSKSREKIATGSYEDHDGSFGQAARTRQGSLSRSDRDRYLCRDSTENAAYRAVTFSGIVGDTTPLEETVETDSERGD